MEFSVFIESVKRLYENEAVSVMNEVKILEWFNDGKITEEEKNYILDIR